MDDNFMGKDGFVKWTAHRNKLKEDPEYKKQWMESQQAKLVEYWKNLKPFVDERDVPELPNPLNEFFTQRLIELGAIPKSELKDGAWYYGNFRNTEFGKWNETKVEFDYINYSFGFFYWDTCNHFEDDNRFALFTPLREVTGDEMKIIQERINSIR